MNYNEQNRQNAYKPIKDNSITLDFNGCKHWWEIHLILQTKFGLPESYGKNWDALWDCLRYLWADGECMKVNIYGYSSLPEDIKKYSETMLEVFRDVHRDTPNVIFELIS